MTPSETPLCARCVMPASPPWITFDADGRLWIVEDRNRSVIVIARQP